MKIIRVSSVEEGNALLKEYAHSLFLQNDPPVDSVPPDGMTIIVLAGVALPESWYVNTPDETASEVSSDVSGTEAAGPGDEETEEPVEEDEEDEITVSFADLSALREEIALQAGLIARAETAIVELRKEIGDLRATQKDGESETAKSLNGLRRELGVVGRVATRESAHARAAARSGRTFGP